jgi:hypothetical protein
MDYEDLFKVDDITIIGYQHIDDPECFLKPEAVLPFTSESLSLVEKVKEKFRNDGWDGDGELRIVWIPSIFYIPPPNTDPGQVFGTYIWHVKQYNNGTSFLGFYPDGLNFISKGSLLALQNDFLFDEENE